MYVSMYVYIYIYIMAWTDPEILNYFVPIDYTTLMEIASTETYCAIYLAPVLWNNNGYHKHFISELNSTCITLWLFNIAMGNGPFIEVYLF